MKTFKQYIQEALDKPYAYKKQRSSGTDEFGYTHHYTFNDRKRKATHVYINHSPKGEVATVDFTDHNGDYEPTGKGTIRHLSTVKKIMQDHAAANPNVKSYEFVGAKSADKKDGGSRARLYRRLVRQAGGTTRDEKQYAVHNIPVNADQN